MKYLIRFLMIVLIAFIGYIGLLYFTSYSEGVRAGRLVKFLKLGKERSVKAFLMLKYLSFL